MSQSELIEAYRVFMETARPFLIITNEAEHSAALEAVESALDLSEGEPDHPMKPLISMLSLAIDRYESQDAELMAFEARAMSIPIHVAVLRTLMDQHQLTEMDLPEIGDQSEVCKVLRGQPELTRHAAQAVSNRFGLCSSMLLGDDTSVDNAQGGLARR